MKWQQAYHRTKANKNTRVTTSERDRKTWRENRGYIIVTKRLIKSDTLAT
jgi:hypothetical protein